MWLKRSTPQNIAIGGAADTVPHVRRWAAVSGDVTVVLVAIIFTLTPPHFWAHALWKMRDYDDAHVTMMSNFTGEADVRSKMSAFPLLSVLLNASPHFLGIPNASIVGLSAIWDMYRTQQKKNICCDFLLWVPSSHRLDRSGTRRHGDTSCTRSRRTTDTWRFCNNQP